MLKTSSETRSKLQVYSDDLRDELDRWRNAAAADVAARCDAVDAARDKIREEVKAARHRENKYFKVSASKMPICKSRNLRLSFSQRETIDHSDIRLVPFQDDLRKDKPSGATPGRDRLNTNYPKAIIEVRDICL